MEKNNNIWYLVSLDLHAKKINIKFHAFSKIFKEFAKFHDFFHDFNV